MKKKYFSVSSIASIIKKNKKIIASLVKVITDEAKLFSGGGYCSDLGYHGKNSVVAVMGKTRDIAKPEARLVAIKINMLSKEISMIFGQADGTGGWQQSLYPTTIYSQSGRIGSVILKKMIVDAGNWIKKGEYPVTK